MMKMTEDRAKIIELYQGGLSSLKIAKKMGLSLGAVTYTITHAGIARSNKQNSRKYSINHSFFKEIDTEEKAYWLGFIYADGYITARSTKQKCIGIAIKSDDRGHLEKINKSMESNYKINTYTSKNEYGECEYVRLLVTSDQLFDDLKSKGVIENKSLQLQFPSEEQVPSHLVRHFLRGYFDGDGSFSISPDNYHLPYNLKICGTREILKGFMNIIGNENKLEKRNKDDKNNWQLSVTKQSDVIRLATLMYDSATIYLDRKHERYQHLITQSSPVETQV